MLNMRGASGCSSRKTVEVQRTVRGWSPSAPRARTARTHIGRTVDSIALLRKAETAEKACRRSGDVRESGRKIVEVGSGPTLGKGGGGGVMSR